MLPSRGRGLPVTVILRNTSCYKKQRILLSTKRFIWYIIFTYKSSVILSSRCFHMSEFKNILGLDLGVTSIGWAMLRVETDADGKPLRESDGTIVNASIHDIGVRIFPATTEGTKSEPKNSKRRTARGQRRLIRRKAARRNSLRSLLIENGLLPAIDPLAASSDFQAIGDPWRTRARALDERLEPFEIGRSIYHLSEATGILKQPKIRQFQGGRRGLRWDRSDTPRDVGRRISNCRRVAIRTN
ncbi:MAG: CRISPR-associated endonuclease Cas9 [Acidobacteria bacterium OLB17]|nr:MAG: CRISPR-associated endonuclease Cas9 [Acidobacteria bacterium OLB17]